MPREPSLPASLSHHPHRSPALPYARPSTVGPPSAPLASTSGSPLTSTSGGFPNSATGSSAMSAAAMFGRPRSHPLSPALGAGVQLGGGQGSTGMMPSASMSRGASAGNTYAAMVTQSGAISGPSTNNGGRPSTAQSDLAGLGFAQPTPTTTISSAAAAAAALGSLGSGSAAQPVASTAGATPTAGSRAGHMSLRDDSSGSGVGLGMSAPDGPGISTVNGGQGTPPMSKAPHPHQPQGSPTRSPAAVPNASASAGLQFTPMQATGAAATGSAKRPGACAECKRLKLGCDRVWPCASCKRRKVAHLCPDGQLESKEISLAQRQIKGLLDRIGALERRLTENEVDFEPFNPRDDPTFNFEALGGPPGSTLDAGGLSSDGGAASTSKGKPPVEGYGASGSKSANEDAMVESTDEGTVDGGAIQDPGTRGKGKGTLRVDGNGTNQFTGGHASSEQAIPMKRFRSTCIPDPSDDEIAPFLDSIPNAAEAHIYIRHYFANCDWMHRLLEEEKFMQDWRAYFQDSRPPIQRMPRHKLAVGMLVMALGFISELPQSEPLDRPDSWVKGAQLCLGGLGVGFTVGVTLDTVAGLNLLAQYLLNADARESASAAWNVIGIALRLCQSMGLHYSGSWDEPEISYRQRLWWETVAMDRFLSLSLGRPYMARSSQTVWPIVLDSYGYVREGVKRSFAVSDFTQPSPLPFHWFKYRLCIILDQCLNDLDSPFLPRREVVARVDNSLKEIVRELPPFLVAPTEDDARDPFAPLAGLQEAEQIKIVAQALMFQLLVHTTHLALHRAYFVDELKGTDQPTSPSFEQCVDSSRKLTDCLRQCRKHLPRLSSFWKCFVGETFTAAVVQATTVIAAPTAHRATVAWSDLRDTHTLFQQYADEGHRLALRTLSTIYTLVEDTANFSPTSPATAAPARPAKHKKLQDGTILTHSGINLPDLLHTCSRFVRESDDVADVRRSARPPGLKVRPPGRAARGPPDPSRREPAAPAARYATGRFDGVKTDWARATAEYDANNLGPSDSVLGPDPSSYSAATRNTDFRPFLTSSTVPSTSHVRRRPSENAGPSNQAYSTQPFGGAPSAQHHSLQAVSQQPLQSHGAYQPIDTSGWDNPPSMNGMVSAAHQYGDLLATAAAAMGATSAPSDVTMG